MIQLFNTGQSAAHLAADHRLRYALNPFLIRFTHADDRHEPRGQRAFFTLALTL